MRGAKHRNELYIFQSFEHNGELLKLCTAQMAVVAHDLQSYNALKLGMLLDLGVLVSRGFAPFNVQHTLEPGSA